MSKNIPIYFYIVTSIVAIIAMILENEWLLLLSRPSIIPALGIYYFASEKKYVSYSLIVILIIYFISDTLNLLQIADFTKYMMLIDVLPYLILTKIVLEDAQKVKIKRNELYISIFGFFAIMLTVWFINDSISDSYASFKLWIFWFGVVLSIFVSSSLYLFLLEHSDFSLYILLSAVFALVADFIYVITNMVFFVKELRYIEFVLQIISCFYVVTYFLKRESKSDLYKNEEIFIS